jgi:hypothetical protein
MILIVTYDLKTVRDYTPFYAAIQQQGQWCHYLASTWLIDTNKTPQQVSDAIQPLLAPTDFLLVVEMGKAYQGWLPQEAWAWINSRMYPSPMLPFMQTPGMYGMK